MEQVSQSLATFQSGLLGVEREMLPIYKLTERLRETQRNIDLCVQELRRVNENFVAAQQLSPTLMNGAKFHQEEYVEALEKLLVAIAFLESHRSYDGSAKALEQAKELLAQARKKCKADFLSSVVVLSRGSRDDEARLTWSKPSAQAVERVQQLLHCLISSNIDQLDLLDEIKDLEALMQPPLLLRDRKGKDLEDPWVLPKTLTLIVSEMATAAKQKLFGFQFELTEQIGAGDRSISKDGNVHPVSSHMLKFLRQVCEHSKPLRVLLAKESNEVEEHFTKEIRPRIEELRDDAIRTFVQVSYGSFETFLCDPKEKLVYAKGGQLLTLESGRLLKEKFTRFNTQLDDIHDTQRHFIVSEPRIRHQLIQASIDAIIKPYSAFYEKYSGIHFSKKNTAKYLKYTPKAAEQLLKELFLGEVIGNSK
ncbi:hypothetical protein P43SY_003643 [Pythium insidiosum]|uniref:Exocyst subunit Exo70 family protein n=1 Tax=Pythium insidiosum TaxID=114742 RepID=A0AAD5QD17_PYTIN|nr:hypothetical protein P43SY_003643 [Pythium insidiosum]